MKKNNKKITKSIRIIDELCTFNPNKEQEKLLNEFMDKNKKIIIFMPRAFGKSYSFKRLSQKKKNVK